ncbi:hypothetical protein [Pontibacter sp. HSC-14F20]|uniref:hypothetical protein n=1 Tax=Pontibacter sp. HSC-14F20 TaxID=2864136 RepID=UPI0021022144|nr:hypothetical protein [Pontibacter sp. HSC-14F20]
MGQPDLRQLASILSVEEQERLRMELKEYKQGPHLPREEGETHLHRNTWISGRKE